MPVQYAGGTNVNATKSGVILKTDLGDWVKDQLVAAGWSASGSSANWFVTSATTPQTLSVGFSIRTNSLEDVVLIGIDSPVAGPEMDLLPNPEWIYRIIANKYQFFIMVPGRPTALGSFVCGGVPYTGDVLALGRCVWSQGNIRTPTDATLRTSFRTSLASETSPQESRWASIFDAITGCDGNSDFADPLKIPYFMPSAEFPGVAAVADRAMWHTGEVGKYPAWLMFGAVLLPQPP